MNTVRSALLAALAGGRFRSAPELWLSLRDDRPGPSMSTVYRNVRTLHAERLLDMVQLSGVGQVYRRSRGDEGSFWLLCRSCRLGVPIEPTVGLRWAENAARTYEFNRIEARVGFVGLCGPCRLGSGEGAASIPPEPASHLPKGRPLLESANRYQ